jgi:hypothetical protein
MNFSFFHDLKSNRHLISGLVLLALILPTVTLSTLSAVSFLNKRHAPSFILPIRGYDPRDLIHGHYLQFQIAWPWAEKETFACSENDVNCRVCLNAKNETQPYHPTIRIVKQDDTTQCTAYLSDINYVHEDKRASTSPAHMLTLKNEPRRFYVDEQYGPILDKIFRDNPEAFSLLVKIHNHQIFVENLLVNGDDYRDYIKTHAVKTTH